MNGRTDEQENGGMRKRVSGICSCLVQMKNYILFLTLDVIITLLLSCCSSGTQQNGESMKYTYSKPSIEVELDTTALVHFNILDTKLTDIYDNIDSIRTIPLETTDESLIGHIERTFIVNDTLFVADYYKTKSVFAFDLQGRFLYKIHKVGQGPGEYQSINMVQIDENGISINDWLSWKLIKYDLHGKLLFEKRLDPHPHDFIEMDDHGMLLSYDTYSEQTPYRLVFTDTALQWKETAMPQLNDREKGSEIISAFQKLKDGNILYHIWLNDTVYQISPDRKIIPKYHLGFHAPGEIASFYEKTKNFNDKELTKSMYKLIWHFDFFELDDMFFICYTKNDIKKAYICIVQKKDYQITHSLGLEFEKGLFAYFPFSISGYYQNSLLAYIDDVSLNMISKKNIKYLFSHLDTKEIQDIKDFNNTDNNPVAVIIYFKKT
jgi:hypothetical protein